MTSKNMTNNMLKTAAVSFIAMTAAMTSARAEDTPAPQNTVIDEPYDKVGVFGNHKSGQLDDYDIGAATAGNTVTLKDNAQPTSGKNLAVYGAYSMKSDDPTVSNPDTDQNTVTIEKVTLNNQNLIVRGGYTGGYNAEGNIVNVKGGTADNDVGKVVHFIGARASAYDNEEKTAGGNKVTIFDGENAANFHSDFHIIGGTVDAAGSKAKINVTDNAVTINGGSLKGVENGAGDSYIYGGEGYLDEAEAKANITGNSVTVTKGAIATEGENDIVVIVGGRATIGNNAAGSTTQIKKNTVTITNGTFSEETLNTLKIYGGLAESDGTIEIKASAVAENTVAIKNGTFHGKTEIWGGYSFDNAAVAVTDNKVYVSDGTFNDTVAITGGRHNKSGKVSGNTAEVSGGTFNGVSEIHGGDSDSGDATGNSVTVSKGTFRFSVNISGGVSNSGDATGNSVTVSGGTFNRTNGSGSYYGGYSSSGAATGNKVTVSKGTFSGNTKIYGGKSYSGAATTNSVTINGGEFGPSVTIFGGYSGGAATENTVTVSGGTFGGGTSVIAGGRSYEGTAENNKVYLSGGEFSSLALYNLVAGGISGTDDAVKNNTVYVYGTVDLVYVDLFAAYDGFGNPVKSGGGNTLVFGYVDDYKNVHPWMSETGGFVKSVKGFDTIRFDAARWGKPIRVNTLDTSYANSGKTKVDATKIAFDGVESVKKGDKTVLLKADSVAGDGLVLTSETSKYTIGTTLEGNGTVELTDNGEAGAEVAYTIDSVTKKAQAQAQTHTAAMGMTAGVAALNQGADTVLTTLKNLSNSGHTGLEAFGAMGGGTARQETGSHVTLNAFNFATGLGSNIDIGAGIFTVGGALEAGYGSFKNHFDAGEADPFVKKSGHLHYYGGAATAGMKWNSLWHTDGLFRLGYAKSEQGSGLYNPGLGTTYDVDIGSYYVGTEVGGGKAFKLDDTNAIDVYARYFWLHKGGDDFYAGGEYDLKAVDSHRLRTGARYDLSLGNKWGFYAGLAYEYEFDGKSRLIVDGVEAEAVKTKGGRAYGELGVKLTPEKDAAGLALDFNVKGAAGSKYRDVLFGVDVKYMF